MSDCFVCPDFVTFYAITTNYLLIAETNAASSIRSVARKLFALICSSKMALQDVRNLAASCNDFRQFCLTCEQMKKRWGLHPALKVREIHFFTSQFTYSQVDEISRHIIPSNLGDCLFNSASLALCQNETLADELRLRTCFEVANNREFYRKHPVLVSSVTYHGRDGLGVISVETLCDLTCFASSSSNVHAKYGFEKAFNNEIMRTAKNWPYSGTLQIMALARVLGVPIEIFTLIKTINSYLFTRIFFIQDNGLILQTLKLWESCGQIQVVGQIGPRGLWWITLFPYFNGTMKL